MQKKFKIIKQTQHRKQTMRQEYSFNALFKKTTCKVHECVCVIRSPVVQSVLTC